MLLIFSCGFNLNTLIFIAYINVTNEHSICTECKEPCNKKTYDASLSYASLSSLNVRKLLQDTNFANVRRKYTEAVEVQQRLSGVRFSYDLNVLEDISSAYLQVNYIDTHYLFPKYIFVLLIKLRYQFVYFTL